jgi:hypothetical protein
MQRPRLSSWYYSLTTVAMMIMMIPYSLMPKQVGGTATTTTTTSARTAAQEAALRLLRITHGCQAFIISACIVLGVSLSIAGSLSPTIIFIGQSINSINVISMISFYFGVMQQSPSQAQNRGHNAVAVGAAVNAVSPSPNVTPLHISSNVVGDASEHNLTHMLSPTMASTRIIVGGGNTNSNRNGKRTLATTSSGTAAGVNGAMVTAVGVHLPMSSSISPLGNGVGGATATSTPSNNGNSSMNNNGVIMTTTAITSQLPLRDGSQPVVTVGVHVAAKLPIPIS